MTTDLTSEPSHHHQFPNAISTGLREPATPAISVVMPCKNEIRAIRDSVQSLCDQQEPHGGFEIIVVDGVSTDGTRAVLGEFATAQVRVRVLDNVAGITSCGMNLGIRSARGRYIAIVGAHNIYAPDYLRRCLEVAERTNADNVGGAVFATARTYVERAVAASHHSRYAVGGSNWHDPARTGWSDSVWGGFYRRQVFDRIGFFDEELVRNQDDELNLRLIKSGGTIWQSPEIKSWYHPRGSVRMLFVQYRQYGYWKVRVIWKHKLPAWRHVVPPMTIALVAVLLVAEAEQTLALLTGRPRTWVSAWATGSLVTMVSAYVLTDLAASVATASGAGWDLLPVLPFVFPAYHFGYGLGFLGGLVDLVSRRRAPDAMARLNH